MDSASPPSSPHSTIHRSRDRERAYAGISPKHLSELLVHQERESKNLDRVLVEITEQLKRESLRANEAERRALEVAHRLRTAREVTAQAKHEALKTGEELRLYKIQLDAAQQEIYRAQSVLDDVEAQKHYAEEAAVQARNVARRLKEEKLVAVAREEGRRQGLAEGLRRGRVTGFEEGRDSAVYEAEQEDYRDRRTDDGEDDDRDLLRDGRGREPGPDYGEPTSPALTQPMLDFPDVATMPSTTPPAHQSRPPSRVPSAPTNGTIHPTIIRSASAASHHPSYQVPPDGWVPEDGELLPPPHEFSPNMAPERPLSADQPILMVPPPRGMQYSPPQDPSPSLASAPHASSYAHPRRRLRRSSPESDSTTLSQMDIISPPEGSVARDGGPSSSAGSSRGRQPSGGRARPEYVRELSVIPEASPADAIPRKPSLYDYSRAPTPGSATGVQVRVEPEPEPEPEPEHWYGQGHGQGYGTPASSMQGGLRPPNMGNGYLSDSQRTSMSSLIEINVEQPSRPASVTSNPTTVAAHDLLSPETAQHALPIIDEEPAAPVQPPLQNFSGVGIGGEPIYSHEGLPPGFMPMSPAQPQGFAGHSPLQGFAPNGPPSGFVPYTPGGTFAPFGAFGPPAPVQPHIPNVLRMDGTVDGGSTLVNDTPRTHGGYASSDTGRWKAPGAAPVGAYNVNAPPNPPLDDPYGSSKKGKSKKSRSQRDELGSDDEVSSSLGSMSSADTLTTPPPRTPRKLGGAGRSPQPLYAEAPLPAGVAYPTAPVPGGVAYPDPREITRPASSASRSTRTATTGRAARAPLPPSTVGVDSPRSAAGSGLSSPAWAAFAGNTPGPGQGMGSIDERSNNGSSVGGSSRRSRPKKGKYSSKLGGVEENE